MQELNAYEDSIQNNEVYPVAVTWQSSTQIMTYVCYVMTMSFLKMIMKQP